MSEVEEGSPEQSVTAEGRARHWLRAVLADVGPLRRSKQFRLLFVGQTVSLTGSMLTDVAVPFQIYALTRSSFDVGLLSLAMLVPFIGAGLYGGALADAVDRRRLVLLTEGGQAVCSALLVVNATVGRPHVWVLFVLAVALSTFGALQRPALDAVLPRVVDANDIPAATNLTSIRMNLAQVGGPALAGVLIAVSGVGLVYAIDVGSFALGLVALGRMTAIPPPPDAERPSLARIAAGFRYARSRQELLGTYAVDMGAMFFGMPEALFPQMAARLGGPTVLGLLFTAPAAGSLLVSVTAGWAGRVRRQGRAIVVAAALWGVAVAAFGFATTTWVALMALAGAGAMDMVSGLMRSTMWNQSIPDALRGRLAGIEMISYSSGPLLGNFEGGTAEAIGGLRFSIVSGGVACVVSTVAIALALPGLWRYQAGSTPGGLAEEASGPT